MNLSIVVPHILQRTYVPNSESRFSISVGTSIGGVFIKTTNRLRSHTNSCRRKNNIALNVLRLLDFNMMAMHAFEKSVTIFLLPRCNIPEDSDLQRHRCENLKCSRSVQSLPGLVERDTATASSNDFLPSRGCNTLMTYC
jgi:hypothetical protein